MSAGFVPPASVIRAVTFDVGGTLLQPWPSVGAVYAAVAARHGARGLDAAWLEARFREEWRRLDGAFAHTRQAWAELVARVFAGVHPVGTDPAFFQDLFEHFATPTPWRVFPDVRPVIESLRRRGLRLGVVSNWDDRLRPLLGRLGLAARFDVILVSAEQGWRKPDPRLFHEAARRLGVRPRELLHVGDQPREDIEGARRAGCQALQVRRPAGAAGDRELVGRLGWLGRRQHAR
ncbi:MAG: HAD-IIIA family hydrolase [Verrucomicrobia bacterium]|nr:MAG: HAD-IIIA family hydrolase [Verrucomicrobiota bacterium]